MKTPKEFIDLGTDAYHTPISWPDGHENLEIVESDSLVTHGVDYHDLMSPQFIRKIIMLIDSGDYLYQEA